MQQDRIDSQNFDNDIEPYNLEKVSSQFKSQYQSLINISLSQYVSTQQMSSKFIESNIQYNYEWEYHKFDFIIHKITQNYQVCEVKILFGKFRLQLLMLNELGLNPFSRTNESKKGSYGRIYFDNYRNKNIALKCLFFTQNSRSIVIAQAIKEYCILKICSFLEVSPKVDKYYGFHFILYDDSIMFAMERGEPITKISNETSLKQLLRKMHSYNIIHYDIKPQNICFSREYNKIVFIDYGLAQIVKQQFGFKSLVYFRGSLRFCGSQMINLFGKQQEKIFVDLYYNDLSCLQNSLKMMPRQQDTLYLQDILQVDTKPINEFSDILQLYHLKFLIIQKQKQEIKKLIQKEDEFLLKKYGRNILGFLKCLIFIKFIEEIYEQYFKSLKETPQYQQIKNLLKTRAQHYLLKQSIQEDDKNNSQAIIFKQRTENQYSSQSSILQIQFNHLENYLEKCIQFLKITDYYLSPQHQEQYLSILIDCLRFDRRNLTAKEKIQISAEFIKLIGTIQNEQIPSLQSVRLVFLYLLKYCISQPYNEWKREKILIIIMQTVILSIDIRELMSQLTEALKNLFVDWTNRLIMALQIYNICNLGSLRHLSSKNKYNNEIMVYFFDIFNQNYLKCLLSGYNSKNKIQYIVSQTLLVFQDRVQIPRYKLITSQIQLYLKKMNCIEDVLLKKKIKEFIYSQSLKILYVRGQLKGCLQYISIIRNQIYRENHSNRFHLNFLTSSLYEILVVINNFQQFRILSENFERIINCEQIFIGFKFRMVVFLLSESNSTNLLQQYSLKMVNFDGRSVEYKQALCEFDNYTTEIHKILKKIEKNVNFCKKNSHHIDLFVAKFRGWQSSRCFQNSVVNDVEVVMYNLSLYKIFWRINPHLKQSFKQNLINMELWAEQLQGNHPEKAFRKFKYYIYAANFYQVQLDKSKSQFFYCKIFELNYIDEILKMKIYCFKNIILLNNVLGNQNRVSQWLLKFYHFNLELGSVIWYFDASAINLILVTITIFQKVGLITELYNLLASFAELLAQYPLQTYSTQLFYNIDSISKTLPQIFQQKQLDHCIGQISWDNRYGILFIKRHGSQKRYSQKDHSVFGRIEFIYENENINQFRLNWLSKKQGSVSKRALQILRSENKFNENYKDQEQVVRIQKIYLTKQNRNNVFQIKKKTQQSF